MTTLTQDQITAIASLPLESYKYRQHINNLIAVYLFCREQWTAKAVKNLATENNLDLRRKEDRAKFGWYGANELAKALPPVTTTGQKMTQSGPAGGPEMTQSGPEAKTVRVLAQAIALLPPVPQTNGLETAPVYRIFDSPIYLDELRNAYRKLSRKWHPDTNASPEAEARFKLITEIYGDLTRRWFDKYSPLIPATAIGEENIKRANAVKLAFPPESF